MEEIPEPDMRNPSTVWKRVTTRRLLLKIDYYY